MLHQVYLLEIDAQRALAIRASNRRAWWPSLVVPRALCVFQSLSCRGLAWHERKQFAHLQAKRLAPFAHYGFNACVRGEHLMLWFWDQHEVLQATQAQAIKIEPTTRLWAEPLLRAAPTGTGERHLRSHGGDDVQTLQGGAIVASRWHAGGGQAITPPLRRWPWSWELAQQRLVLPHTQTSGGQWSWRSAAQLTSALGLLGTACYASYWGVHLFAARQQLQALQTEAENSERRLGDAARFRTAAGDGGDWVSNYMRLSASIQWPELLRALRPPFERHGVVMKEMEVKEDEVRLVVVSAGSDIDLPGLLRTLQSTPGLQNVQLRAGLDSSQATFSLRASGFMSAASLRSATATKKERP
jgi:hypothetical protein